MGLTIINNLISMIDKIVPGFEEEEDPQQDQIYDSYPAGKGLTM